MVGAACARRLAAEGCEVVTSDRAQVDLRRQAEVEAFIGDARPDAAIVEQINAASVAALATPEATDFLAGRSFEKVGGMPAALAELVRQEAEKWPVVVRQTGITADG